MGHNFPRMLRVLEFDGRPLCEDGLSHKKRAQFPIVFHIKGT